MFKAPTVAHIGVHHADMMKADHFASNGGSLSLHIFNADYETFDFTIYTGDAALAVELSAAINGVLAKHNRLEGAAPAATAEAA